MRKLCQSGCSIHFQPKSTMAVQSETESMLTNNILFDDLWGEKVTVVCSYECMLRLYSYS